jgi:hypothetical protein
MKTKGTPLRALQATPPWEWPQDAGATILSALRDAQVRPSERLLAAELGGDFVVINEELACALLSILRDKAEPEDLRSQAAISMGAVLEAMDQADPVIDDPEDAPISADTFEEIQQTLRSLHDDPRVPDEVRRHALESSARAERDWHAAAVRAALASADPAWRLTAVFCMQLVRGFEAEILEALQSTQPEIRYEAVCAAGTWALDGAWPLVTSLAASEKTEKGLRLAAIAAVGWIRPQQAPEVLGDLVDSDDEDVAEAAVDALALAEGGLDNEGEDEDEDEDKDDDKDDDNPRYH